MLRILVVDDNEDLRKIFKLMLNDCRIDEANNGLEALKLISINTYDLILMDILMPEMDGIAATKEILKKNPKAVIVAITAFTNRAKEILEAGAVNVLDKPIRKNTLVKKLKEYTEKKEAKVKYS